MNRALQVCSRCVMDTSAPGITFDEQGICIYCTEFLRRSGAVLDGDSDAKRAALETIVKRIKAAGKRSRYDCVVGVSGGVDSSWVLVKTVESGLRPLAVHMDNGWNSELAQNNIANLVRGLGVDLHTHVIEWGEYRRLMQAFFDSDVVDVELLYDNAMIAVNYRQAARHGIKTILAGTNQATEGVSMPPGWNHLKFDARNLKAIARELGPVALKSFPSISTLNFIWYEMVRSIRWLPFLDHLDYVSADALSALERDFGYKPYPYKHYESVFTRFYQGYILPEKFGVDKRKVHLSTLVVTGQMSREAALRDLGGIAYASERDRVADQEYFLKKMGWSPAQLDAYLARPPRSHMDYPSEKPLWEFCLGVFRKFSNRRR